ncbi:MAG: SPFH domain-containing protein [Planctomycetota bacterium]
MMQRAFLAIVVGLVVIVILAFMTTYTVRFTETAVVTRAGERVATVDEPGLRLKFPLLDSVTKYDKRLRLLESRAITQQTADDSQIVVEAFATWRVNDPYVFYQRFRNAGDRASQHFQAADDVLETALVSALPAVSQYRIDELFTSNPGGSRLPELENRILEAIRGGADNQQTLDSYGIEVTMVGINRVLLPDETTNKVVERMGATRDRLAQEAESQGEAEATAIRAQAQADAEKIRLFATRRASEIIARGEAEAAEYLLAQRANEDLAVFLRELDFMRNAMAKRFTLVLPSSTFGMGLFSPASAGASGSPLGDGIIPVTAPAFDSMSIDVGGPTSFGLPTAPSAAASGGAASQEAGR